jgi:hypothetical protein
MSHWQGQAALSHRTASGAGFGRSRGFGSLGALGGTKSSGGEAQPAMGAMVKEVLAFMQLDNNARDGSFASSISQAPSWVSQAASNTVGVQLRLAVVSATVNRVQLRKEVVSGQRDNSPAAYVRRATNFTGRPAQTAAYAMMNLFGATVSAGLNATYYLGGWFAQWVSDVGSQVFDRPSTGRSAKPSRIGALYDDGIAVMTRLNASAAVAYLERLKRLRIPDDVAGVVMPGGDPKDPNDRRSDPLAWLTSSLWTNLPTWGKVAVVAGGVGIVASVAAPYAKIGAAILPSKRKNPRRRRKRRAR